MYLASTCAHLSSCGGSVQRKRWEKLGASDYQHRTEDTGWQRVPARWFTTPKPCPSRRGKIPLTSWTPSLEEERRIFRVWKGFTLAKRTKDTVSWIWDYGVEIQSEAYRRWICMPCVRQNTSSPQSYESEGTQNAEHHLWKSHGYWDPSGRRRTPLQTKEGGNAFASITDLMGLKRSEPNDQALANNLIRRFDQAEF